jgi:hypothetical protein
LFAKAQDLKEPVMIRIVQNRMTAEDERILDEIRKKRRQGRVEATLPRDSRSSIPEREAVLQLRYASYSLKRPQILNKIKPLPEAIDARVIYVKEEKPAEGKSPIEWFLAANEPVNSVEEAVHDKRSGGNIVSQDYPGPLGGPMCTPSDGPPGVKTIWTGLMKLYILPAYREYPA